MTNHNNTKRKKGLKKNRTKTTTNKHLTLSKLDTI